MVCDEVTGLVRYRFVWEDMDMRMMVIVVRGGDGSDQRRRDDNSVD